MPQDSGNSPMFKEHLDNALRNTAWILGGSVRSWTRWSLQVLSCSGYPTIRNIEANMYLPQSQISTVYKLTSKTLYVQTRTSPVSEFISLLPYLSEGNGSFPSTSQTIQRIPPTSFTSLILHPLPKKKSRKNTAYWQAVSCWAVPKAVLRSAVHTSAPPLTPVSGAAANTEGGFCPPSHSQEAQHSTGPFQTEVMDSKSC